MNMNEELRATPALDGLINRLALMDPGDVFHVERYRDIKYLSGKVVDNLDGKVKELIIHEQLSDRYTSGVRVIVFDEDGNLLRDYNTSVYRMYKWIMARQQVEW